MTAVRLRGAAATGGRRIEFWKSDWFVGLAVSVVMFILGGTGLLQGLEYKAYDLGVSWSERRPSERIAIIAIDKQSIDNIGRWPWSREIFADMIEKLGAAKAKVIAFTVFFSEPQRDPGLAYIERLTDLYRARLAAEKGAAGGSAPTAQEKTLATSGETKESTLLDGAAEAADPIAQALAEARQKLDPDKRLAAAIGQAGNVALPILLQLGAPVGRPDQPLPDFIGRNAVQLVGGEHAPLPTLGVDAGVIDPLGRQAAAIGHLNTMLDSDGAIRKSLLVMDHFGQALPALSLRIAAQSLNLAPTEIEVRAGESVRLGRLVIGTDSASRMLTFYYGDRDGKPAFSVDSFYDVVSGKIPYDKYRDKIVLIGATAAGVGSQFVTPVSPSMPSVQVLAHEVSSILSEHFFVTPTWGAWVAFGVFLAVAGYLTLLLPRLSAGMGAAATLLLLAAALGAQFGLMVGRLMWLPLMGPASLLLVGHVLLTTKRFFVTERGREMLRAESAESNRMLGLAFQSQGQLDMAFDKFRKCPLDDQLMDNLYSLALDFERKRQFNKAEAVFRYMADFNPGFRDIEQRLARARQMAETVILGGPANHPGGAIAIVAGAEKPMLGRYQIEKELGKGAMGMVYLGRDPKIDRVVAIKTLALSQEFDEEELQDVKERFFREAQTAGRLNHPNIVQIYDAGEEHDLAYIAMEFLSGHNLAQYTKPGNLLPLPKVISIVARVAEALDYAHARNVVHRDIKPANIMYDPESDQVKVTDFGIARITDSSRTKTGMVLGTPSYMSPEQLAGKKIDGRSDLFSLGVTLYQLCSGHLPFGGETLAQLMFKIANEPHQDIRGMTPDLPECLAAVIDKALLKNPDRRYQSGGEFARDLRACLAALHPTGR